MNFDDVIEKMSDEIIQKTQEIIRIRSVEGDPLPGKPFGQGIGEVIDYMLQLGSSMGFKTKNLDGYAGYIEYGEGTDLIGILAHLDVVPEGNGWTYPPYAAEIHDGKIYGRGSMDDKGPAMASLYAMKAIKDSGIKLNKRVRLILGLDEESGWQCIEHYKKVEEIPSCAFTPDGDYPVIYAEKGIVNYKFSQKISQQDSPVKIISIKGGNRPNMVADFCEAVLAVNPDIFKDASDKINKLIDDSGFNINIHIEGYKIILESHGQSAHGSTPEIGINAISKLMTVIYKFMKMLNIKHEFIDFYGESISLEIYGDSLGCAVEDEVSGKLTFNIGLIDANEDYMETIANIRYPVTYEESDIYDRIIKAVSKYGIQVDKIEHQKPLYVPKDNPLVQKLMKVYKEFTGDTTSEPLAIGGGTYARAIDNAVAFGAAFPGELELAHQKDEYIKIDSLIKSTKIYARAIYELAK